MKKQLRKLLFCIFSFALLYALPVSAGDREIVIGGDFPMIGTFQVMVFQSLEDFFRGNALSTVSVPATHETVRIPLENIPDGSYLISVRHDANDDGRMNSNAFGVPTEAGAFYLPVPPPGGVRPQDAFVTLGPDDRELNVTLTAPPADRRAWGAGAMVIVSSNPYRGGDTVVRPLPMLTFVGERLYVVGPRGGYNLMKSPWLNVNANAEFKFAGDAFKDEAFLAGMEKRRDTLMAGLDTTMRLRGSWRLEASAQADVLDRHNGQEGTLALSRNVRGRRWQVTPGAGLLWRTSAYNAYYFGVRPDEANEERPAYRPGASVEWFARIFGRVTISDSWSVLGSARIEWLSDDVRESPITSKNTVTTMFLGINYAF